MSAYLHHVPTQSASIELTTVATVMCSTRNDIAKLGEEGNYAMKYFTMTTMMPPIWQLSPATGSSLRLVTTTAYLSLWSIMQMPNPRTELANNTVIPQGCECGNVTPVYSEETQHCYQNKQM